MSTVLATYLLVKLPRSLGKEGSLVFQRGHILLCLSWIMTHLLVPSSTSSLLVSLQVLVEQSALRADVGPTPRAHPSPLPMTLVICHQN